VYVGEARRDDIVPPNADRRPADRTGVVGQLVAVAADIPGLAGVPRRG
jgi:hypothetical protein